MLSKLNLAACLRAGSMALAVALLCAPASSQSKNMGGKSNFQSGQGQTRRAVPAATHRAPEIDPSIAGGALTLLLGGMCLLTDRRRPRVA